MRVADAVPDRRVQIHVLLAASLVTLSMGSLYAWSVYLIPMEEALRGNRTIVSLIFATATFAFAIGMYFVPKFLRIWELTTLFWVLAAATFVAHGLTSSLDPFTVWLSYGLLFGLVNGIAYGSAIHAIQIHFKERRGLATGLVVASYALGAIIAVPLIEYSLQASGLSRTVFYQGTLVTTLTCVAAMFVRDRAGHRKPPPIEQDKRADVSLFFVLWAILFLASCTGIMVLGHASAFLADPSQPQGVASAAASVTGGNLLGRLAGGWFSDRSNPHRAVAALQAMAAVSLTILVLLPASFWLSIFAIGATGVAYGWIASAMPAIVGRVWGPAAVGRVYGQLFTAWGAAALVGPLMGGYIFDQVRSYVPVLVAAAAFTLAASILIFAVDRQLSKATESR